MQCVVLAGGLGTRMRPTTERIPKTLLPVLGSPFAHWQLSSLRDAGVRRVCYLLGHLGGAVRDYVGDGSRWGLRASYVDDGGRLLGTAGAIRHAIDLGALDEHFLVVYGDSYLSIDIGRVVDAYRRRGLPALMTVYRNNGTITPGNADLSHGLVVTYRKGDATGTLPYVDYGLGVLTRATIRGRVPAGLPRDLAGLCEELSRERLLAGFESRTRFYEVGSPEGLADLEAHLRAAELAG